jgi:hypothetical protein
LATIAEVKALHGALADLPARCRLQLAGARGRVVVAGFDAVSGKKLGIFCPVMAFVPWG